MKKINQNGFSAIGLFLVIGVLTLIGIVGWFVYDKQKTKTPINTTGSTFNNTNQTSPDSKKVLKIPELGIQLSLSDKVQDATYAITSKREIGISSKALESYGPKCRAATGNVAVITTFTDPKANDVVGPGPEGMTNIEFYPDAVLIDNVYYVLNSGGIASFPCTNDEAASSNPSSDFSLARQIVKEGFKETKIEKID